MCVCVRQTDQKNVKDFERERERESVCVRQTDQKNVRDRERESVCVCV